MIVMVDNFCVSEVSSGPRFSMFVFFAGIYGSLLMKKVLPVLRDPQNRGAAEVTGVIVGEQCRAMIKGVIEGRLRRCLLGA